MQGAVFLDRDGVVNRNVIRDGKPCAPRTLAQFRLLPGVKAATRALKDAGYPIVIVTNQPDIGNNFIAPAIVEAMHERLHAALPWGGAPAWSGVYWMATVVLTVSFATTCYVLVRRAAGPTRSRRRRPEGSRRLSGRRTPGCRPVPGRRPAGRGCEDRRR